MILFFSKYIYIVNLFSLIHFFLTDIKFIIIALNILKSMQLKTKQRDI